MVEERRSFRKFSDINPLNDLKAFIRNELGGTNEPKSIINASIEFATAAFYMNRGQGDPWRNVSLALRQARKLGLTDEDTDRARAFGWDLFSRYIPLSSDIQSATEPKINKQQKKIELQRKFRRLMLTPNDKFRIADANRRNKVRNHSALRLIQDSDLREKLIQRTLTQDEYYEAIGNIQRLEDPIKISWSTIGMDAKSLVYRAAIRMQNSKRNVRRFGGNWGAAAAVKALLEGSFVSARAMREADIDVNEVLDFCFTTIRDYAVKEGGSQASPANGSLRKDLRRTQTRSQNPQKYLRDPSES